MRIVSAYFPDSRCSDAEMEDVYGKARSAVINARSQNIKCIVAGDFNAQAGSWLDGDDPHIIGTHGSGLRNERGQFMVAWCHLMRLSVLSSLVEGRQENAWTYRNGNTRRTLDYILAD